MRISDWSSDVCSSDLLARDTGGALARAFAHTVDGQFQTFAANDGAYNRAHFFNQNPELAALVADWSDEAIDRLRRGGHDILKIHAAYHRAVRHRGQPTMLLRSEEHTSQLQSLMRNSYADIFIKTKTTQTIHY